MSLSSPDQIALPDFNAGAMENWGLVTYRETALLYDPIMSSTGNKERVTTVISHELAHMVGHQISPSAFFTSVKITKNNDIYWVQTQAVFCSTLVMNVVDINSARLLSLRLQQ